MKFSQLSRLPLQNPTPLWCTLSVTELSTMSICWHITCLLLLCSCTPGFFIHGIVGGKVSVSHSRPYMVYIRDKVSKQACCVFLVTEDYVMTAAHYKQSHLMAYLEIDDTNFLPDGVEVDPLPHPEFSITGHDILLLKLKTPATLNRTVNTITLPKPENEEISKDCMVMGWGWKKYDHVSPSNCLVGLPKTQ
ncbi:granzyme-like protein 1 [Sinocyclocheilus anshuiensis]|uniref:granzyme-like protein 1 n=1 Tax=Sinocyclocheilus anshuiensis TaxID=1608454 RepID=UPI0007B8BD4A|nr:PREDICTED: granzyme-like protein 1 [Sinocyclocheilus anshuiensis]